MRPHRNGGRWRRSPGSALTSTSSRWPATRCCPCRRPGRRRRWPRRRRPPARGGGRMVACGQRAVRGGDRAAPATRRARRGPCGRTAMAVAGGVRPAAPLHRQARDGPLPDAAPAGGPGGVGAGHGGAGRRHVEAAEWWLAGSEPFEAVTVLPQPPGVLAEVHAAAPQWRSLAAFARQRPYIDKLAMARYPMLPLPAARAASALATAAPAAGTWRRPNGGLRAASRSRR